MREPPKSNQDNRDLALLAMLLAFGMVVFELSMATTDHDNTRAQHMGGAVAYAKGQIDLWRPMLPGFTANGTPTPLEFPLWQALTAVLMKCFGIWYGWGNVVSLFFFFSSLVALFDLCRRICSVRTAWWAVVFSLLQPVGIWIGGQAGGDSTAWSFAMWFIYFCYRMMNDGGWGWWIAAVLMGCLNATTKAPFFMVAGLTTFFWLLLRHRRSPRAWLFLSSSGLISFLALLAWNHHCQRVYGEAEFQTLDLDTTHGDIFSWYFGTMAYRLNPYNWVRGGWHLVGVVFGGLTFILGPLLCVRLKQAAEAWLFLLAAVCTTLVFTPLLLEHIHYFFIFAPAAAWLCAIPAAEFESAIWSRLRASMSARVTILLITFMASLAQTAMAIHFNLAFDNYQQKIALVIKEHTAPSDKLLVWGLVWGDPFLRADRQGMTGGMGLGSSGWINDPAKLERLQKLGYDKLVFVNPSPFVVALTAAVAQHGEKLEDLHLYVPAVAKAWPIVFDSPQLLIVQMPAAHAGPQEK